MGSSFNSDGSSLAGSQETTNIEGIVLVKFRKEKGQLEIKAKSSVENLNGYKSFSRGHLTGLCI